MATKAEKQHLNKIAELGCIVCINEGLGKSPAELHHIRTGQGMAQRASNYEVIPLCHVHHRTGGYGVAFHAGKGGFESRFGTEKQLLIQVEELLSGRN